jgi:hypothetical protein
MTYVKPELLVLTAASVAIHGGDWDGWTLKLVYFGDARTSRSSTSAYEADE